MAFLFKVKRAKFALDKACRWMWKVRNPLSKQMVFCIYESVPGMLLLYHPAAFYIGLSRFQFLRSYQILDMSDYRNHFMHILIRFKTSNLSCQTVAGWGRRCYIFEAAASASTKTDAFCEYSASVYYGSGIPIGN